ncbi:MAG TPA: hypothetical protein VIV61_10740 [Candidatus Ozemobacteraceae bacterium]
MKIHFQYIVLAFIFIYILFPISSEAAGELALTEEMVTRYLAVYDTLVATSPETAARLFRNEPPPAGSPEASLADAAVRAAGFADMGEFSAADVIIGTAWLQLTAQEMAESAEAKKREAIETLESTLEEGSLRTEQRAELELALERLRAGDEPARAATDTELVDPAGIELLRRYRERLQPVMQQNSAGSVTGF